MTNERCPECDWFLSHGRCIPCAVENNTATAEERHAWDMHERADRLRAERKDRD